MLSRDRQRSAEEFQICELSPKAPQRRDDVAWRNSRPEVQIPTDQATLAPLRDRRPHRPDRRKFGNTHKRCRNADANAPVETRWLRRSSRNGSGQADGNILAPQVKKERPKGLRILREGDPNRARPKESISSGSRCWRWMTWSVPSPRGTG